MQPRTLLRIEGGAVLAAVLGWYVSVDGSLLLLAALALAPDLSMAAYLADNRVGARVYNAAHTYTLPILLGGAGLWTETRLALLVAAIWAGHIGADRLVGYGLKFDSGFEDTPLDTARADRGVHRLTGVGRLSSFDLSDSCIVTVSHAVEDSELFCSTVTVPSLVRGPP